MFFYCSFVLFVGSVFFLETPLIASSYGMRGPRENPVSHATIKEHHPLLTEIHRKKRKRLASPKEPEEEKKEFEWDFPFQYRSVSPQIPPFFLSPPSIVKALKFDNILSIEESVSILSLMAPLPEDSAFSFLEIECDILDKITKQSVGTLEANCTRSTGIIEILGLHIREKSRLKGYAQGAIKTFVTLLLKDSRFFSKDPKKRKFLYFHLKVRTPPSHFGASTLSAKRDKKRARSLMDIPAIAKHIYTKTGFKAYAEDPQFISMKLTPPV